LHITGATADFASTFSENVDFTGTTGTLELAHSETYTGQITGFSKTGGTALYLQDIPFVGGTTKASYSGTAASGVLTVADGAHVAKITLEGNYLTSTFTLSAAPGGGTKVVDPAAPAAPHLIAPAPLHQFIAAMAGFAASGGMAHEAAGAWPLSAQPILTAPRMTQPS